MKKKLELVTKSATPDGTKICQVELELKNEMATRKEKSALSESGLVSKL